MARRPTRVLPFPVRADPEGQIELFPEPAKPSPFSSSQLIIRFTLLQIRVTRIASRLSPLELCHLLGQEALLERVVERYEAVAAEREQRRHRELSIRIA